MLLNMDDLNWQKKKVLSEAPEPETDNYQMDMPETEAPDDEGTAIPEEDDVPTEDAPEDGDNPDDAADDYQMDAGSEVPEEGDEDPTAGEEVPEEDVGDAVDDSDNLKKLVLLRQFKEMSLLLGNLDVSIDNLAKRSEFINDENVDYLQSKVEELKEKLSFVISKKFISYTYKELLKIFYYFKFNLSDLAEFSENLIKERDK